MDNFKALETKATNIRKNIITMVTKAGSGHPGGSLSAVEILTSLYFTEMNVTEENVNDNLRDKFVLSKGHASPLLYSVLHEKGFISTEDLSTFRQVNSKLQGHPNMNYIPAVDMSTGSLGQGISTAVGMAISNKIHGLTDRVYTLLGDGELEEGQVWEAAMAAAHYKLDNLLAIVDFNGLQIDGDITKVMNPNPIDKKFEAFGWNVLAVDGHNYAELLDAYQKARETKGQPTVIIAKTVKGKGVSFMENQAGWHGVAPTAEQCEQAINELGGNE
ncbi:transketolase [Bacillus testis]|uniref:transketolase n=1 Tax=Bacillus testis TaxID=1622072 RepID=UPI000A44C717|nr:transketolase [Bacillus testis]